MNSQPTYRTRFWSIEPQPLLEKLRTTDQGLAADEARRRLEEVGGNVLGRAKRTDALALFLGQFKSPVTLILLFAAVLSAFLGDGADTAIILAIVFVSGLLGFWQERGAANAVGKLLEIVQVKVSVMRDGASVEIPVEGIVPGDVVTLSAGSIIPADGVILESKALFVDEATLTGETFPVEKMSAVLPAETALAKRTNMLWMGTHVVSGSARAVIAATGQQTEFGQISRQLSARQPETEFEHGVRRFGYLLMEVTLMLVIIIFFVNVLLARPVLDSFLFSLALAVGLTPQLLPAIISVNLAHGARRMAADKVIVKRLASIENFGSMNVLCCDKTGTLTAGTVRLHSALNVDGAEDDDVLFHAWLNAHFETGFANPIDEAIRGQGQFDETGWRKLDEEPYDFVRKRLSVLVAKDGQNIIVTKGALPNVLTVCANIMRDEKVVPLDEARESIEKQFEAFSAQGYRVLGVASRTTAESLIDKSHETGMTFIGFLLLFDPLKPGIADTVRELATLGISLKIITGDNRHIAASLAKQVGLSGDRVLTGAELRDTGSAALIAQVQRTDVFAEVEPNQKERIILALRQAGNVTGYMGDGINDATALHAADVGISVESAVDVAKEAADIVLLEQNLEVLVRGVAEGRRTFANTLKYVFMATSANFGNMFSMAGASLFLPFLPLLPKQILLMNVLTDLPEMTIATDAVDPEMTARPRRWDIRFIRSFMIVFGLVSSIFDYLTFAVLGLVLHASPAQFRTGWFLESVTSAALIVLVVRTRRPFMKSKPGRPLLLATLLTIGVTLLLPFTPLAAPLGLERPSLTLLLILAVIVTLYILAAEMAKKFFYRTAKD